MAHTLRSPERAKTVKNGELVPFTQKRTIVDQHGKRQTVIGLWQNEPTPPHWYAPTGKR